MEQHSWQNHATKSAKSLLEKQHTSILAQIRFESEKALKFRYHYFLFMRVVKKGPFCLREKVKIGNHNLAILNNFCRRKTVFFHDRVYG